MTAHDPSRDAAVLVQTDADGRYNLVSLDPTAAGHEVCFAAARHRSQCYDNVAWDGDNLDIPPGAKKIEVRSGETVTGIDAVLN